MGIEIYTNGDLKLMYDNELVNMAPIYNCWVYGRYIKLVHGANINQPTFHCGGGATPCNILLFLTRYIFLLVVFMVCYSHSLSLRFTMCHK